MTVLRTPDERFENLPDYSFKPNYLDINGMRMHYVYEGRGDEVILCLHGEPTWSFLYRHMIPPLAEHYRVVAPDLFGFGRSDKPAELEDYSYQMHHKSLVEFIESLDLRNITLICQDWGGLLGLPIAAEFQDRFSRLVVLNTFLPTGEETPSDAFLQWRAFTKKIGTKMRIGDLIQSTIVSGALPDDVINGYNAPYPDDSYKAGAAMFPLLVPISPDDPTVPAMLLARERLSKWEKPAFVLFSDSDPILGGAQKFFLNLLPTAKDQPIFRIRGAGHFLQEEKGAEIAQHVHEFIQRKK